LLVIRVGVLASNIADNSANPSGQNSSPRMML
jgi:hypothetical protein